MLAPVHYYPTKDRPFCPTTMVPSGGDPAPHPAPAAPHLHSVHLVLRDTVSRGPIGLIDTFDQFLFIEGLI
jgi:hypothetical protein